MSGLELWGGVECTIARVGDNFRNQLDETGHWQRTSDIGLIASLGVRTLRFPILWEVHAPEGKSPDFSWSDERLAMLREQGIEVIAGLLHHGSGPRYTDLLDPMFPEKFADYAAKAALRYPWIRRWTPVNEPLTTARFSCLYGHWYPHRRDYSCFLTALVHQCRAIAAAMAAIRSVIPDAELVQTEDLGRTFATAPLRHQAAHDNERRWLSLDLLCGRVGSRHSLRQFFDDGGVRPELLDSFEVAPTVPDIIGINHYLTSDRYLDHRLHFYPGEAAGGNGRDRYADVEAVRIARLAGQVGLAERMREAWRRYRRPLAVTEVHHGCTRDEQLRWFWQCWRQCETLRGDGIDLRAVTLWALFGNHDWRSLLTRREGAYDPGAFDVRAPIPRPTAIANLARTLARGEDPTQPVLAQPGWWRRPERLYTGQYVRKGPPLLGQPLLITGATGTLGQALARICSIRGLPFRLTERSELDICDERSIRMALSRHQPWAVINAAGFVRVAEAELERDTCFAWNADGPERLARACAEAGIAFMTFSSDLVFGGAEEQPRVESDAVDPRCVYGESKAEAERRVLAVDRDALIIRTAAFFSEWDRHNFAYHILAALERGDCPRAAADQHVSPTYVPDLCHAALDLLIDQERGVWHLTNPGVTSWLDFGRAVARGAGYDPCLVLPAPQGRWRMTALASERGQMMRPFGDALAGYLAAWRREQQPELVAAE